MYPEKSGSARSAHGFCTVGVSEGSLVSAVITRRIVSNFVSGQQCQPELRFYFRACILQKFYQGRHRDGQFAFSGYSLWGWKSLESSDVPQGASDGFLIYRICNQYVVNRQPELFSENKIFLLRYDTKYGLCIMRSIALQKADKFPPDLQKSYRRL